MLEYKFRTEPSRICSLKDTREDKSSLFVHRVHVFDSFTSNLRKRKKKRAKCKPTGGTSLKDLLC